MVCMLCSVWPPHGVSDGGRQLTWLRPRVLLWVWIPVCSMIKVSRALEHLAHPYGSGFIDNSSVRSRTKLIPGLCIPSQCVCVCSPHTMLCVTWMSEVMGTASVWRLLLKSVGWWVAESLLCCWEAVQDMHLLWNIHNTFTFLIFSTHRLTPVALVFCSFSLSLLSPPPSPLPLFSFSSQYFSPGSAFLPLPLPPPGLPKDCSC